MRTPHPSLLVADIKTLELREETIEHSPVLLSRKNSLAVDAIFKCRDTSPSEVFGYLLAQLLDVPTPQFCAVCLSEEAQLPGDFVAATNHLAILVERIPSPHRIQLADLSIQDPSLAARLLSLCIFARDEYPEILGNRSRTVAIDLERIGPVMLLDEFITGTVPNIKETLTFRQDEYDRCSCHAIEETMRVAQKLRISDEFDRQCSVLSQLEPAALSCGLRIEGYPLSPRFSAFFQACVSGRQARLAEQFGTAAWPSLDWISAIN